MNPVSPSKPSSQPTPGVYAKLEDLIALQYRAKGFSFLPRQPVHSILAGKHASRLRGRGLNFEEIRRYQPGDDVRQIDWKVTLRTRKTHCRVYTEEKERCVLLIVDQRLSMFFGSVRNMKSVTAAEAAALAAWRVVAQKDRVGALVFNDTRIEEIRPHRSRARVMQILNSLVGQNLALSISSGVRPNPGMLNEALRRAARLATHDFLICVITDGAGDNDETRDLMTRLGQHNDVLVGFVHDPLEIELPNAGPLIFSDGAGQMECDTGKRALREGYRDDFAKLRATKRQYLLHRETPVIPLSTAESVSDQLRNYLGRALG